MSEDKRYEGFPVFIIWDTIAATPTRAQVKTGEMYGGGMAERARILKTALMTIFPLIEKQNVLLVLLNQVMAEIGGWRPGITSAGGNALKHDIHMRLQIDGGKTQYDGVYATSKYSDLSISKSKISPIMGGFNMIIDITKGGVIDRSGSLIWWMTNLTNPALFNQASWWSVEEWCWNKYLPYWKKFPEFSSKFRQTKLYEVGSSNQNFIDFLQLIWLDLISDRYVLQKEVVKPLRDQVEARLLVNLGVTLDEIKENQDSNSLEDDSPKVSLEDLNGLAEVLGANIDQETGEVVEDSSQE